MKAWAVVEAGEPLQHIDLPTPEPVGSEVLLEVRVDNTRAQKLYQRFGFEPIGFRKGYYQPGNVDALVMRRDMKDPVPAHQAPPGAGPTPGPAASVRGPQPGSATGSASGSGGTDTDG